MPTRKIKDPHPRLEFCRDPEHNPPTMMVYENGTYVHQCPSCKRTFQFTVCKPTLGISA